MIGLSAETPEFEQFVEQASDLRGLGPLDRGWLLELWTGAGSDLNIALNHLLETPDEKVRRAGSASSPIKEGGGKHKKERGREQKKDGKEKEKASKATTRNQSDVSGGSRRERRSRRREGEGSPTYAPIATDAASAQSWQDTSGSPDAWGAGAGAFGGVIGSTEFPAASTWGDHAESTLGAASVQPWQDATGGSDTWAPSEHGFKDSFRSSTVPASTEFGGCANWSMAPEFKDTYHGGPPPSTVNSVAPTRSAAFLAWSAPSLGNTTAWPQGSPAVGAVSEAFAAPAFFTAVPSAALSDFSGASNFDDSDSDSELDWWGGSRLWIGGSTTVESGFPGPGIGSRPAVSSNPAWGCGSAFGGASAVAVDELTLLDQLLAHSGQQVEAIVSELCSRASAWDRIGYIELEQIAAEFAQRTGVSAQCFGNLTMMYERFDFNGDGRLDAIETSQLVKSCLRWRRRANYGRKKMLSLPYKNISDNYTILKKLGEGGQGAMYLVSLKQNTDQLRCIKFYDKSNANAPLDDIREEFELMRTFSSPLVARTFEIFEDQTHVYLVNEPYFGGDLTKLIRHATENGVTMTEDWFRHVLLQPVQGVQYLNQQHVMHCDLKEANIMVAADSDWHRPHVVLIDFGLAQNFVSDVNGVCGTPGYIPPETWEQSYWVPKGDVFSLGVIFFQLLAGIDFLFAGETMDSIANMTCIAQPPFQVFSDRPDFQALVVRMLEKGPNSRSSILEVAQHAWFSQHTGHLVSSHVIEQIMGFSKRSEAQLKLAEALLDRCNLGGLKQLNDAFMAMDRDMSGTLTIAEVQAGLARLGPQLGWSQDDANMFAYSLADSSGNVSYKRFMAAMLAQQKQFTTADLWAQFCEFDKNRNGVLDGHEIISMIRSMNYPDKEAATLFASLDKDKDGRVTFEEFKRVALG